MGQRFLRRHALEVGRQPVAKRTTGRCEHQTSHILDAFPEQALPDGRVLAVDGTQAVERIATGRVQGRRDQVPASDQRLLVGEGHAATRCNGCQDGRQRGHPGGGDQHDVCTLHRGKLLQAARAPAVFRNVIGPAVRQPHPRFRPGRGLLQQVCLVATGGQSHHPEAIRMSGHHFQRLATDGPGRTQDGDADHVPAPTTSNA